MNSPDRTYKFLISLNVRILKACLMKINQAKVKYLHHNKSRDIDINSAIYEMKLIKDFTGVIR